ncbi:uncharacterized protein [Amphiura filiformis]|uniref:uncharacterized protein n=1 Tax=Amphiura filiformis TaxID=82378 RepID=UPI003B218E39
MAGRSNTMMTWRGMFTSSKPASSQNCECGQAAINKNHCATCGKDGNRDKKKERIYTPSVLKHFHFNGWHTLFRALLMTSFFSVLMTFWVVSFPVVEAAIYARNLPMIDEGYVLPGSARPNPGPNKRLLMTSIKNPEYDIEVLGEPTQRHNVSKSIMSHIRTKEEKTSSKTKPKFDDDNIVFELLKRHATLDRACQKYKLNRNFSSSINLYRTRHVIVDDKYKILFHYVPKVACMTWKTIFTKLARSYHTGSDDDVTFRTLSDYTEAEMDEKLRDYKKVLFVREPLRDFYPDIYGNLKGRSGNKAVMGKHVWRRHRKTIQRRILSGFLLKIKTIVEYYFK